MATAETKRGHVNGLDMDALTDVSFLGIDPSVPAGYETIRHVLCIKGNGTAAQFVEIHSTVIKMSPNDFNITRPVRLDAELEVE